MEVDCCVIHLSVSTFDDVQVDKVASKRAIILLLVYRLETCVTSEAEIFYICESVNISTRNENRYLERLAIVYWTGKRKQNGRHAFDATMCQKKTQSRILGSRIGGQESTASDQIPD